MKELGKMFLFIVDVATVWWALVMGVDYFVPGFALFVFPGS